MVLKDGFLSLKVGLSWSDEAYAGLRGLAPA